MLKFHVALVLVLSLISCSPSDDADNFLRDFESRIEGDLGAMDGTLTRLAEEAADLLKTPGRSDAAPVCVASGGDCSLCYDLKGTSLDGDFTVATDPLPCSVSGIGYNVTTTYSVSESSLVGTWQGSFAGDYTIEASGERSAEMLVEAGDTSVAYDSGYEIVELSATTEDSVLTTYDLVMTYGGFNDRAWAVEVSGTATGVLGTATTSGGVACTIDGTFDGIEVVCSRSGG